MRKKERMGTWEHGRMGAHAPMRPCAHALAFLLVALCAGGALAAQPGKKNDTAEPGKKSEEATRLYLRADRREFDPVRGIGIAVGNVQFIPPNSDSLILADAAVIWSKEKEAYLEGNVRIHRLLEKPRRPGGFNVPRPKLTDRKGLEPAESLEEAGDLDDIIEAEPKTVILIDTRVAVSEAERVYVNWAAGTSYMVKPTLRFTEAERVANWVVTAPSLEGIATYEIPVVDKDGKPTGKFERRSHYVANNATFTTCSFKDPHTRLTATHAEGVDGDFVSMKNVLFQAGGVSFLYLPYLYADLEYKWPRLKFAAGSSSRLGAFASIGAAFQLTKGVEITPRIEVMSERGIAFGLGLEYHFGHKKEIRGALDAFWLPSDSGTDYLADTSRKGSGWPAGWTPAVAAALGPMPSNLPLGVDTRYRFKFVHQQEYPKGWEFDLEVQKFSDAGVYREFFEKEFKTEKTPETQALLKYGRNNWAVFIHLTKQLDPFITQTEYLPQIGFNWIAQPIGGGFLFNNDTELANVTTRYGDVRQRYWQSDLDITRIWLSRDEYSRPPALTLRQNDTDKLSGWRFDTVNTISRPFELGVFDIEPWIGWRGSWFEHGLDPIRTNYVLPPLPATLPAPVAAAPDRTGAVFRNQLLAGIRVATQFHRTYDVDDRPFLRRLFENGMRHVITPEVTYVYEGTPTAAPNRLPENDAVTEQAGLHKINFALRNRWQTKWAPEIKRQPGEPLGGEWFRRKLAAEKAQETDPVNVIDLDVDIDLFLDPARDNINLFGQRVRRWSNLRTDLAIRPWRKTSIFFDTEFNPNGSGGFETISAGFKHRVSDNLVFSLSNSYHFHDESVVRLAADWEIDPKWHLTFDLQQDLSGGGKWDRTVELTRRFHEWQLTLGYQFDRGKNENLFTIHVGPSFGAVYRPSWRFQPRSEQSFLLVESAR